MKCSQNLCMTYSMTKLRESGVLCGNITGFGVGQDHLSPQGQGNPLPPTPNEAILPFSMPDKVVMFIYCTV